MDNNLYWRDPVKKGNAYNDKGTEERADYALCLLFCHVFLSLFVLQIFTGLSSLEIGSQRVASLLCKASIGIGFVVCVPALAARIDKMVIRVIFTATLIMMLNWLCFPANQPVLREIMPPFFTNCMPMFVCAFAIRDEARLFDCMIKIARVIAWATLFLYPAFALFFTGYSMSFSYALMVPCMTLFAAFGKSRHNRDLILGFVVLSAVVLYGSRGALLCIVAFVFFLLLQSVLNSKKRILIFVLFSLAGLVAVVEIYIMGPVARVWLETQDIQSRTLRLLLEGGLHLSGRGALYRRVGQAVWDAPFTMHGIGADRLLLGKNAHNIVLELLYEGGLLIGLPLLLFLFKCSCQSIQRSLSDKRNEGQLLFFCASIPFLMVSGSIWSNMYFWIWLAFCAKTLPKRNVNSGSADKQRMETILCKTNQNKIDSQR